MKKKNSRDRTISFPAPLLGPADARSLRPSTSDPPADRARRIFVITQVRRLPATDVAAGKKLRRILIFDDHPDSLRLALGQSTKSPVHRPAPQTARWWDPVLGWMLIIGAVLVMFSPLFLKFTS